MHLKIFELKIQKLAESLAAQREDTRDLVERKQTLSADAIEKAKVVYDEQDYGEEEEENFRADEEPEVEEEYTEIYNPLKLPMGWDGKQIPYWLYKLHGLDVEYPCEICDNFIYMGRKAFDRHYQEWRHAHGIRCLKIPNTMYFQEITRIQDAYVFHEKEDTEGNVFHKKTFEGMISIVPATPQFVDEILAIQEKCYAPEIWESKQEFLRIVDCASSFVAIDNHPNDLTSFNQNNAIVVGYILAHPWPTSSEPPILHKFAAPQEQVQECHFIHDVSISPDYRGMKIADMLLQAVFESALVGVGAAAVVTLVSVNGTVGYWQKRGFVVKQTVSKGVLQSYPNGAQFMFFDNSS
ncbi:hypothetical protein HK100_012310 [Physocladia obscura]|uniref:N-acetyltransferase domain-containing protein n=1 Tax=Physocladia obscura TaxID=109957 RepID=A0AAD5XGC0_9FUNG|nr:hypothetical protein HK100_012310 [Physocladia obscura]